MHQNHQEGLSKCRLLGLYPENVWGPVQESTFLGNFQVILMLLVLEVTLFGNHCFIWYQGSSFLARQNQQAPIIFQEEKNLTSLSKTNDSTLIAKKNKPLFSLTCITWSLQVKCMRGKHSQINMMPCISLSCTLVLFMGIDAAQTSWRLFFFFH